MSSRLSENSAASSNKPPIYFWILIAAGGVIGLSLAEPGDIWGNAIPSTLTFAALGLILGSAAWITHRFIGRRR